MDSVTRLCAMNLLLHGIGGDLEEDLPVVTKDALAGKHGEYEIVLANPPFGKKSSVTIVNEAGETSKESLIIIRHDARAPRRALIALRPPGPHRQLRLFFPGQNQGFLRLARRAQAPLFKPS